LAVRQKRAHSPNALPVACSAQEIVKAELAAHTELMLVTNAKGHVCHITSELAQLLGRTRQQAMALQAAHIIETLMVRPFSLMHRDWLQVRHRSWLVVYASHLGQTAGSATGTVPVLPQAAHLPVTPSVYSCRAGMSVLMQGTNAQGQAIIHPFSMDITKKTTVDSTFHVAILKPRTMAQVGGDDQSSGAQQLHQSCNTWHVFCSTTLHAVPHGTRRPWMNGGSC
jgi:hypothetical protein